MARMSVVVPQSWGLISLEWDLMLILPYYCSHHLETGTPGSSFAVSTGLSISVGASAT